MELCRRPGTLHLRQQAWRLSHVGSSMQHCALVPHNSHAVSRTTMRLRRALMWSGDGSHTVTSHLEYTAGSHEPHVETFFSPSAPAAAAADACIWGPSGRGSARPGGGPAVGAAAHDPRCQQVTASAGGGGCAPKFPPGSGGSVRPSAARKQHLVPRAGVQSTVHTSPERVCSNPTPAQ